MRLTPQVRNEIRNLSSEELAEMATTVDSVVQNAQQIGLSDASRNAAEVHAAILNEMHRRS